MLKIKLGHHSNNIIVITVLYCFFFYKIKAALVSIKDLFQNHKKKS